MIVNKVPKLKKTFKIFKISSNANMEKNNFNFSKKLLFVRRFIFSKTIYDRIIILFTVLLLFWHIQKRLKFWFKQTVSTSCNVMQMILYNFLFLSSSSPFSSHHHHYYSIESVDSFTIYSTHHETMWACIRTHSTCISSIRSNWIGTSKRQEEKLRVQ